MMAATGAAGALTNNSAGEVAFEERRLISDETEPFVTVEVLPALDVASAVIGVISIAKESKHAKKTRALLRDGGFNWCMDSP